MKLVVAGGTGFLGTMLVNAWREEGHRVLVLTRRPRGADDVAWSPGSDDGRWAASLEDADAVVNLAGAGIADRRWTTERKKTILQSRLEPTRAIATACRAARVPPRVLLNASATGIYGNRGDQLLTEETPPGSGFLADVCRAWEAEATHAATVARVVLLRTGVVLDKHGGALPQIARPFRFFAGGPIGSGRQYMSWIHVADWIGLVRWALETGAVSGPLNLTAPTPVTNAEFSRTLGGAMGRPSMLPVPGLALKLALGEMADALLLGGQRVLPARAQAFGYQFLYPTLSPALAAIYNA